MFLGVYPFRFALMQEVSLRCNNEITGLRLVQVSMHAAAFEDQGFCGPILNLNQT